MELDQYILHFINVKISEIEVRIKEKLEKFSNIDCLIEEINNGLDNWDINVSWDLSTLQIYFYKSKILAQLALNYVNNKNFYSACTSWKNFNGEKSFEDFPNQLNEPQEIINFISKYLIVFHIIYKKEKLSDTKRKCRMCSSDLSKSDNRCPICLSVYVTNVETIEIDKSLDSCYKKRQADEKMEISAKNSTVCIYCDSNLDGDGLCTVCGSDFGKTDFKKEEKSEEDRNDIDTKNCNTSPINLVMNEEKTNFSLHRKLIPGYSDGNYLTSKEDTSASETGHNIRQTKYPENYTIKSKPLSFYYEDREKGIDKNKVSDELKVDLRDNPESLKNAPLKLNLLGKSFDAESDARENEIINLISDFPIGSHDIDSDKNCGFESTFDVIDKSKLNVGVHENKKLNSKCSQFGSTTNQSSPIVDAESAVADDNLNCISADSDSVLKDQELGMGIVKHVRKRSKTLSEVSTHSNDKGEAFGNAKLESDKKSSLGSWLCSYCTYRNDEKAANCAICMEFRNAQKKNVNDAVINVDLDNKIRELLKDALCENDKNIEKRERSLESLENTTKNTWECKICTCVNDESVNHCEACFMTRDEVTLVEKKDFIDIDIGEPDERWFCKKCNTRNEVDVVKCSHCSSLADFVNKWKCEKCTFYNYALFTFCRACYYKNPHLAKCSQCRYVTVNIQLGATLCLSCDYWKKKEEEDRKNLYERKQKEKETIDKLKSSFFRDYVVLGNEDNNQYNGMLQRKLLDDSGLFDQKTHGEYDMNARQFNSKRNETLGQNKIDENKAECPICRKGFDKRESRWCQTCEQNRWHCPDKDCRRINFVFSKYCVKCGIKYGSDLSNGHSFYKLINNIQIELYKCEHCHRCNDWKRDKCVYCKRPRQIKIQCGKCFEVHDPREFCRKYKRYIGSVTSV